MFFPRIPLSDLIDLCRVLRHQLSAGLTVLQVLTKQKERGPRSVRAVAGRLVESLSRGKSLAEALEHESAAFPPLFLSMVTLGEATGHLPEVLGELEKYYQLELQLRRQFRSAAFVPTMQFIVAVLIVAGVIWLLGFLAGMSNTQPMITIFGLPGAAGAAAFVGSIVSVLVLVFVIYLILSRMGRQTVWMHRSLLALPAIGPCLFSLAMSRLSLALQLTLDSGLSITEAVRLSLNATGDAYFASHADIAVKLLDKGKPLHKALEACKLFPSQFIDMVFSAETSGSVPEMMRHLTQEYQDETARRMTQLTRIATGALGVCVAGFIIFAIFRLYMIYFTALGAFTR